MMKSAKARLTLARIALEEAITTSQEVMAPDAVSGSESEKIEALRKIRTTMESKRANIVAMKECVNEAMGQLHVVYELLDEPRKQAELPSYEQYLEVAVEAVSRADQFCAQLIGKKAEMEQRMADIQLAMLQSTRTEDRNMAEHSYHSTPTIPAVTYTMPAYLPRLEIPKFSGRRADWDNFWAIFSANIHEQNISPMLKFNYLWQYLEGEARALISRYQVSEENYPEAIACLMKKYGDNDTRIEELFVEIYNSKAEWKSTKSQTELLEKISATMSQLAIKGQDVDHRMLLNTIFSKFDADIQTRALEKRADLENPRDWTWAQMQKELSGILQRRQYIEETRSKINVVQESSARRPSQPIRDSRLICMYCKRFGHQSSDCRTVKESERAAYLTKNRFCFNCGKPYHTAEVCRSPPCYKCGQKHDISLCGVLTSQQRNPIPQERRNYMTRPIQPALQQQKGQPAPNSRDAPSKKTTKSIPVAHQNVIQKRFGEKVNSKDEKRESRGHTEPNKAETLLLTGTATILGENGSKEVKILLDTGSETSFIDRSLVEELQLPIIETAQLRLRTFGSNEVTENRHKVVEVKIMDKNEEILTFHLYDSPILTAHTTTATLTKEDLRVIKQKGIHLSTKLDEKQCPAQILLGCDYLWDVMEQKKEKLPSGLHLISTKFGYMISGRQGGLESPNSALQLDEIALDSERYDDYWGFESSGVNEYTGPETTEKQRTNGEVAKRFKETIERRADGYHVHLPWKENAQLLPTNKSIAFKRLQSSVLHLNKNPELLAEYDAVIKDQLDKGIIEPVQNDKARKNTILHYLPHQAVITPKKPNTKLRIVFDASAHYVGKLSLNDALHQGPLFLPSLVGMMQRFRMGKTALIADVEKAFLQVHLHEDDRDATRFLWLYDTSKPPTDDNIAEYRFTRVTFGLNSSPFLLAATIRFHLETADIDEGFANKLNANLYVDNLLICAESTREGIEKYQKAKKTFEELNMNLREFISNDKKVNKFITKEDKSNQVSPKVLGIQWNTKSDTLEIKCNVPSLSEITKKTVLHANASVYDPMGWLNPLLIRNKVFFQSLWKKDYPWDNPLEIEDQQQWNSLSLHSINH